MIWCQKFYQRQENNGWFLLMLFKKIALNLFKQLETRFFRLKNNVKNLTYY